MLDGPSVARALVDCGVTHVVWIPDSDLGTWESALQKTPGLDLIRVCREGEAFAIAAGLILGGKHPVVVIQCTGFFEAGDAFRNVVHDLRLPIFLILGVRGYLARQKGATVDTCPVFAEPIVKTWQIPYVLFDGQQTAVDLADAYKKFHSAGQAGAVLIAE